MRCMVIFCKNKGNIPGMTYFMLTSRRHDPWMRALGRDPTKERLTDKNCVCHVHFREEDKLTSRRHDSWMRALGRDPTREHLSEKNCVCDVHFRAEDKVVVNNKLRLKPEAFPCLNLRKPVPKFHKVRSFSQLNAVNVTSKQEVQAAKTEVQADIDGYQSGQTSSVSQMEDITNIPEEKKSKVFCRMCLEPIAERNKMVPLTLTDINFASESARFKQKKTMETFKITSMIQIVMPDFDFNAAYNPIACHKCVAKLMSAYEFIERCQENESIIQLYKSKYCPNVKLVSCEDVAQNKSSLTEEKYPGKKPKTSKKHNSTETISGSLPGQNGSQLGQSGSRLGQSGSQLGQSGSQLGQSGSQLGQSGSQLGQSGSQLGQSGSQFERSGSQFEQSCSKFEQSGSQLEQSSSQLEQSGRHLEQRGNTGLASHISQVECHGIVCTSSSASQENLATEASLELCNSVKRETEDTGDYGDYGGESDFLGKSEEMSCVVKEEMVIKEDIFCNFTDIPNKERIAEMDLNYPVKDEDCFQPDALNMSFIDDYW